MTASGSKGGQETPELTASCTAVVRSFLEKNEADRPIYVTPEVAQQYVAGFEAVPTGLLFRLYRKGETAVQVVLRLHYQSSRSSERYNEIIRGTYGRMAYAGAAYRYHLGQREAALLLVR